jgi:hypothetical protein
VFVAGVFKIARECLGYMVLNDAPVDHLFAHDIIRCASTNCETANLMHDRITDGHLVFH